MKKLIITMVLVMCLLLSCEKTDPRLQGIFVYDGKYVNQTVEFKGNVYKKITKYLSSDTFGNEENIFEYNYKIKFIYINEDGEGGIFFAIHSFYPNSYFNDPSKIETYNYFFDKDELCLENKGDMTIYKRK